MSETPTTAILTELLKRAAEAHGVYEKAELGGVYDQNWPQWYAEHMTRMLREQGLALVRADWHQRGHDLDP